MKMVGELACAVRGGACMGMRFQEGIPEGKAKCLIVTPRCVAVMSALIQQLATAEKISSISSSRGGREARFDLLRMLVTETIGRKLGMEVESAKEGRAAASLNKN